MKLNLIVILLICLSILTSCGEEASKSCGSEDTIRYFAAPSFSPQFVLQSGGHVVAGNTTYTSRYQVANGLTSIHMIAVGSNICPHEPLSAFSTMLLNSPDPAIRDYITFITPGAVPVPDEILPSNGTVYDKDELFPFISKGDTTSFSITATITFPTKGGWKEDSTYIFTLVNSLNLGGNYKIAE